MRNIRKTVLTLGVSVLLGSLLVPIGADAKAIPVDENSTPSDFYPEIGELQQINESGYGMDKNGDSISDAWMHNSEDGYYYYFANDGCSSYRINVDPFSEAKLKGSGYIYFYFAANEIYGTPEDDQGIVIDFTNADTFLTYEYVLYPSRLDNGYAKVLVPAGKYNGIEMRFRENCVANDYTLTTTFRVPEGGKAVAHVDFYCDTFIYNVSDDPQPQGTKTEATASGASDAVQPSEQETIELGITKEAENSTENNDLRIDVGENEENLDSVTSNETPATPRNVIPYILAFVAVAVGAVALGIKLFSKKK